MIKHFVLCFLILVTVGAFAQDLTATQSVPASAAPGSSFTVEININRGSINGFMKFFQELPPGFTATEIDSKGGSFSFADNGAKVVWIAPPNEATYTVSYKVTVPVDASGPQVFNAKFSYINNNERKIFDFEPKTISIEGSASANANKVEPVMTPVTKSAQITPDVPPAKPASTISVKETTPTATTSPVHKVPTTAASASSPSKTYRVQIGAFSSKPKLGDVSDISTVVLDNGITKYFSGNFATLEEATKRKEEVAKKGFPGAFIVSFENGKIVK
jgi:hypothetical protein